MPAIQISKKQTASYVVNRNAIVAYIPAVCVDNLRFPSIVSDPFVEKYHPWDAGKNLISGKKCAPGMLTSYHPGGVWRKRCNDGVQEVPAGQKRQVGESSDRPAESSVVSGFP